MFKRIKITSRYGIRDISPDCRYAVISISDPHDDAPAIPQHWGLRGRLKLNFCDLGPSRFEDSARASLYRFMNANDAEDVRSFIEWVDDAELLIIHCEAGVSRSPSMGMALCDTLRLGRDVMDWPSGLSHADPPNRHVYDVTCGAWPI